MTPLLVITGFMLAASAFVKLRAAGRAKIGVPVLSAVEVVAAVLIVGVAFTNPPTVEAGFRMVMGGILLILVSKAAMVMKLSAARQQRADSEGLRLRTYVK